MGEEGAVVQADSGASLFMEEAAAGSVVVAEIPGHHIHVSFDAAVVELAGSAGIEDFAAPGRAGLHGDQCYNSGFHRFSFIFRNQNFSFRLTCAL